MQSGNILIVEDDLLIQYKISSLLESEGYTVSACESGEEALSSIASHSPDLVLMDIGLEGEMNGIEAAKVFHRKGIAIIFISDLAESEVLQSADKTNPVEYLVKPFNNRQILVSVKRALNSRTKKEDTSRQEAIVDDSFFIHPNGDKLNRVRVKFDDITFIQAGRAYSTIFTSNKKRFVLSENLKDVLSMIPKGKLYRVHRSYALNPKWITGLKGRSAIVQEHEIPITDTDVWKSLNKI